MKPFLTSCRRFRSARAGFTLVELLVVIAIIGILAAAAYPVILGQIAKAHESVAVDQAHSICLALFAYGSDTTNNGLLPYAAAGSPMGSFQLLYTAGYLKDPATIKISGDPAYAAPNVAAGVITLKAHSESWGYTSNTGSTSGLSLTSDPSALPVIASVGGWSSVGLLTDVANNLTVVAANNPFGLDGVAAGYLNMSSAFCKAGVQGAAAGTVSLTPNLNLSFPVGSTYTLNKPD